MLHGTAVCGKLHAVSVAHCNCSYLMTNHYLWPRAKDENEPLQECLWKHNQKTNCLSPFILLSYGLSFQDERQGTDFVTTFDKEHCALSAPLHTKLQKMLVCRIHHYPPFPYQQLWIFAVLGSPCSFHPASTFLHLPSLLSPKSMVSLTKGSVDPKLCKEEHSPYFYCFSVKSEQDETHSDIPVNAHF